MAKLKLSMKEIVAFYEWKADYLEKLERLKTEQVEDEEQYYARMEDKDAPLLILACETNEVCDFINEVRLRIGKFNIINEGKKATFEYYAEKCEITEEVSFGFHLMEYLQLIRDSDKYPEKINTIKTHFFDFIFPAKYDELKEIFKI